MGAAPIILREHDALSLAAICGGAVSPMEQVRWQRLIDRKAAALQRRLGLGEPPFSFQLHRGEPSIVTRGVVGALVLGGRELQIAPKYVAAPQEAAAWGADLVAMVVASGHRWASSESRRVREGPAQLIDLVARAYADALSAAVRGDPIRRWRTAEIDSPVLRGRLQVAAQLRRALHEPGRLLCEVPVLDTDNPTNHLLHWAARQYAARCRHPQTRRQLLRLATLLPPVRSPVRLPTRLPTTLSAQDRRWQRAVDLAGLLARGRSQQAGGGSGDGYTLVVSAASLFEGFLERTLARCVPQHLGPQWSVVGQEQRRFATPLGKGRPYYTRPDDVVYEGEAPRLLIDAKYKLLGDPRRGYRKRARNSDLYQLAASLAAHGCTRGLLLHPHIVGDERYQDTGLQSWRVTLGGADQIISSAAVDLSGIASPSVRARFEQSLCALLQEAISVGT